MKNKMKRPLALLLCLLTVISVLPGGTAFAASQVTIDSESNSGYDYFEYLNSDGDWADLNTPKHTILETGQVLQLARNQQPITHIVATKKAHKKKKEDKK